MNPLPGSKSPACILAAFSLIFGFATALPGGARAADTVAITEFLNASLDSETTGEWIELYNYGPAAVSLTGWSLVDEDTDVATLPSVTISAGGFVIVARDKAAFEVEWLAGVSDARVVSFTGNYAMSDTSDELILKNGGGTVVWRIAYVDDDTEGRATFLTGTDFSRTAWGTKAAPAVNRRGTDVGGGLGYESDDATADSFQYTAGNLDRGSPLQGHYAGAAPTPTPAWSIDVAATGQPIHRGVRGAALSDMTLERPATYHGIPDSLAAARGSSIRGVAGGLYADIYDWRTRVSSYHSWYTDDTQPRPPTLQFLRWARDYDAELFVTANTRGLVEYDPVNVGKVRYYTSDTLTLASLAADWVRYANHIAPTYRQGDTIADSRDAAILSSLVWSSAFSGDSFDTLPAVGESVLPRVTYWEIGNEPNVSVSGGIGVSNGFTMNAAAYFPRYKAIATAMKTEDPAIKVGPCLVNGSSSNAAYVTTLAADPSVPIDFIAYHPYQRLGDETAPEGMEAYLGTVYSNQRGRWADIRNAAVAGGRDPDAIEMVASEVNVSNWPSNDTMKEGEMAHALGSVETVFTYARLGLTAAHYWIWLADQDYGTPYPVFMAFEKLRDFMGDTLIDFRSVENRARVYTTRDSETGQIAVWALNFQDATPVTFTLSLTGLPGVESMRRLTLKNPAGTTTLSSGNYSAFRAGGPRNEVEWVETSLDGADPADLDLVLEPATISVVLIEPVSTAAAKGGVWTLY